MLADLLAQLKHREQTLTADGGQQSGGTVFSQTCRDCNASFNDISIKRLATMFIERQTQDLFAGMSQLLRGNGTLQ